MTKDVSFYLEEGSKLKLSSQKDGGVNAKVVLKRGRKIEYEVEQTPLDSQ